MRLVLAKPWQISHWLNTRNPITQESLLGKVVLLDVFQMLCPGCVSHALPQAMRVAQAFNPADIAVIGLHSVFENHNAQGSKETLAAFLHEYKIDFPVGIDSPDASGRLPQTMASYGLQGTPTTILIDRRGNLRKQKFGFEADLVLGAEIMSLILEPHERLYETGQSNCDDAGCAVPTE
ncbi:TlpA disulfide reductase family protein [Aquidulcibacter sp.]|jgi:thiol-disulfide isomerase/thioredoxin|uniref:TlpA disulfide reductase family protein n=1 Tax=Aquidulcibacter sp. TaxID=2052990 RepID=UPI003BA7506F